jgi:flagellar protein FliS
MSSRAAKMYAENNTHTSVTSADSGQIIVLVYERIFDHLKVGKQGLENGQYAIESFTKAHDLIQQGLLACLDYEVGVEVAQNLGAIYEWSLREIIAARSDRSAQRIQGVIEVLQPLYEAWLALSPKEQIMSLSGSGFSSSNETRSVA